MSIVIKIGLGVGAAILIAASVCVTIAALFQPKEYKGNGKLSQEKEGKKA